MPDSASSRLPARPSLDQLRKQSKDLLRAWRDGDPAARQRGSSYKPDVSAPLLADAQYVIAREHGFDSWPKLVHHVTAMHPPAPAEPLNDRIVASFLQMACWDHHEHGKADHRMYDRAAQRLLEQYPELARHSLYTTIVCGNLAEVRRILAERPAAAREPGGSRGWTPILYSAYTRFTAKPALDNGVEIARLLLDHGANPNDFYMAGDSEYSCLVS